MQFVDTNIFIRFLVKDDSKKAQACSVLLESANKGLVRLQTTESVIAEIIYILSSKRLYCLGRQEILDKVAAILRIRGLSVLHKRTLLQALFIYAQTKLDFEDAILVAHMEKTKTHEIFSYDTGFDKIPSVKRLEP